MAIFKLGAIVTEVAGSIGGTVLKRGANNYVMQNKPLKASKQNLLSNNRLGAIGQIFSLWNYLSDSEREAWNLQATMQTFPNKFGDAKYLTGRQLFSKVNISGIVSGNQVIDPTGYNKITPSIVFSLALILWEDSILLITLDLGTPTAFVQLSAEFSKNNLPSASFTTRKTFFAGEFSDAVAQNVGPALFAEYPFLDSSYNLRIYASTVNEFNYPSPQIFTTPVSE
jgi:hypothetical protein